RGMKWLGLDWDEGPDVGGEYGPYIQSARGVIYHWEAEKLLQEGKAYRCFCPAARQREMKLEERRGKLPPGRGDPCRNLNAEEIEEQLHKRTPRVIKFRMPDTGEIGFRDVVRGDFTFSNAELEDFILLKSDGSPTYNFAVVVDDARMKISHVIRGDDHISNTPRQVHLYLALGYRIPRFVHLPMILGNDHARLSKRHGATSIDFYRERHYLSDAMINYLALLGWSYDGKREFFKRSALIKEFSLKKVSKSPAVFDNDKMQFLNSEHFKEMSLWEKTALIYDVLDKEGYIPPDFEVDLSRPVDLKLISGKEPVNEDIPDTVGGVNKNEFQRLALIVKIFGNRLKLLKDIPGFFAYFYKDDFSRDEKAVQTHLHRNEVSRRMEMLADEYEKLKYFDHKNVEEALRGLADRLELEAGELIHPCRVALTGGTVSPDIFWVIVLLGKAKTVERLRAAAAIAK
ncbi:MAG: glutamate--tRNA ligase, partial [Candidatus Krumholzibacteriota bacterium]|nr:glutamate--tRNA ligase [Candidatus Krumholzibacteriota bacterium]